MADRNGEKFGWLGGWSGGFLWVLILVIVLLAKGRVWEGLTGIFLVLAGVFLIMALAPWRHPTASYWKLLVPVYLLFFLSGGWAIQVFGGLEQSGLSGWSLFLLILLVMPIRQIGRRR